MEKPGTIGGKKQPGSAKGGKQQSGAQDNKQQSQQSWKGFSETGNVKICGKHEGKNPALSCAILPSNKQFAIGWSDGIVEIRDAATFQVLKAFESPDNVPATSLSINETNKSQALLLASYASGHTILWDILKSEKLVEIKEERQTLVNTFSIDYQSFALGGSDGKIQIHDSRMTTANSVLQGTLDPEVMDGHKDRVFALRFHPSRARELVSGGWDDTVQFWDVRYPYSRQKIHGPHIGGNGGIEFLTESTFITASWRKRNALQVWDYDSAVLQEDVKPDEQSCFLYCCTFVESDSTLLIGGSHKNMLRVVDANAKLTMGSIHNLPGAVYFAKALPKTDPKSSFRHIVFCSENSIYEAQIEK